MKYQAPAPTVRPNNPYTATYKELLAAVASRPYNIIFSHSISSTGPLYFCLEWRVIHCDDPKSGGGIASSC
jgi:hypothetical protein